MTILKPILIEGYTPEEILSLPPEQFKAIVFTGKPLVFKAGSAQILGEFALQIILKRWNGSFTRYTAPTKSKITTRSRTSRFSDSGRSRLWTGVLFEKGIAYKLKRVFRVEACL